MVNLRLWGINERSKDSLREPLEVLVELQKQGLIRHLGLSHATPAHYAESKGIGKIVCVQNEYNLAHREDDEFIDELAKDGIAYVPFFRSADFRPCNRKRYKTSPTN